MKPLLSVALLALTAAGLPLLSAAETKSPPAAGAKAAAQPALAGRYTGKWKGATEGGGELRLTLKQDAAAAWVAEGTFTFENAEVPMKLKSVEIDGAKIRLDFSWVIDGSPGQSKLTGELAGDTLGGTFQTVSEPPSSGTWSVTRS